MTRFPIILTLCLFLLSCGQAEDSEARRDEEQVPLFGSLTLFNASDERHVVTVEFKEIYSEEGCDELRRDPSRLQDPTFAALTVSGPHDLELFSGEEIALHDSQWGGFGYPGSLGDFGCFVTLISSPFFAPRAIFSKQAIYGPYRPYFHNRDAPEGLLPDAASLVITADYSALAPGASRQGWRAVRCPDVTDEFQVDKWCVGVTSSQKSRASRPPQGARYTLRDWRNEGREYQVWTLSEAASSSGMAR